MKILFFSSTRDISSGSYRIWVHDLNKTFLELGFESKIIHTPEKADFEKADVIICGKSDANTANTIVTGKQTRLSNNQGFRY